MSSSTGKSSPRISLLKPEESTAFGEASMLESMSLSNSSTATFSGEPPIPASVTYEPTIRDSTITETSSNTTSTSTTWDYDNYIEKPRGHVAQPRFVNTNVMMNSDDGGSSGYFSPSSSFTVEQMENGAAPFAATETFTSLGLSPVLLAILAYFLGAIGGLVIILLERKNLFVVFHAYQSLACGAIAFFVQLLFIWTNTIYTMLWIVYLCVTFFMIVKVIQDAPPPQRLFKIPVIGDWCEQRALNRIQFHSGVSSFFRL